jgi:signal transduction histidine kinase/CheY-like chemotaxis protein
MPAQPGNEESAVVERTESQGAVVRLEDGTLAWLSMHETEPPAKTYEQLRRRYPPGTKVRVLVMYCREARLPQVSERWVGRDPWSCPGSLRAEVGKDVLGEVVFASSTHALIELSPGVMAGASLQRLNGELRAHACSAQHLAPIMGGDLVLCRVTNIDRDERRVSVDLWAPIEERIEELEAGPRGDQTNLGLSEGGERTTGTERPHFPSDLFVVVVDDDALFRVSMASLLAVWGIEVRASGAQVDMASLVPSREEAPQLVAFVDLKNPCLADGLRAATEIQTLRRDAHIYLMSGEEDVFRCCPDAADLSVADLLHKLRLMPDGIPELLVSIPPERPLAEVWGSPREETETGVEDEMSEGAVPVDCRLASSQLLDDLVRRAGIATGATSAALFRTDPSGLVDVEFVAGWGIPRSRFEEAKGRLLSSPIGDVARTGTTAVGEKCLRRSAHRHLQALERYRSCIVTRAARSRDFQLVLAVFRDADAPFGADDIRTAGAFAHAAAASMSEHDALERHDLTNRYVLTGMLHASAAHDIVGHIPPAANYIRAALTNLDTGDAGNGVCGPALTGAIGALKNAEIVLASIGQVARDSEEFMDRNADAQLVSVNDLLQRAATMARAVASYLSLEARPKRVFDVIVEVEGDPGNPLVLARHATLLRVVLNLCINGIEHMRLSVSARGYLTLSCGVVYREDGNRVVQLRVRDSGPGVPRGAWDRIFDPQYTTKPEGLGLGLSIVRRAVQGPEVAGDVQVVESIRYHRTTFMVELPVGR